MYSKPTLKRWGTLREVTKVTPGTGDCIQIVCPRS